LRAIENTRPVSLTDRVYEELVRGVVAGELRPGDKLTDRRLAEQLGVSRTPVREALQRMVSNGLADPRGRAGWTVASLDEEDLAELFELRGLLEPAAIRSIVARADPKVVDELDTFFDSFGDSVPPDRQQEYFALDTAFHSRIVSLCGNSRIIAAYRTVELQVDLGRHRMNLQSQDSRDATLAEHRGIATAIRNGDADLACERLNQHLSHGRTMLLETIRRPAAKPAHGAPKA
jgi:GntR family transcriptional regulator, rspAB operon transcriptional repressor